ncbi:MAG: glycosyltransferase family 4 protein [Myxococcales bacterium]
MRIAAFISHPIQYFTPLWRELSTRPGVALEVFYFGRHGLEAAVDRDFGVRFAWNIDLLEGHKHRFLPRQWPTTDPLAYGPRALNSDLLSVLREGWDAVFIGGYAHLNNWFIAMACRQLDIPVLCFGDTNPRTNLNKSPVKLALKRAALSVFFRNVTAFLAAGGQSRRYFELYGAKPESVFICPYSVDVKRFRDSAARLDDVGRREWRRQLGLRDHQRIVMFCGKLVEWKRPGDIVQALARLAREDLVGVFVGDGPLRKELEREGGQRVRMLGFVNQSEIPQTLSMADVLVLSSSIEPYGMVVAEAQSLGVPAIVSDSCGCYGPGSVVADGVSGLVYPTGDVASLAASIERVLADDTRYAHMRQAARVQGDTQSEVAAADGLLDAVRFAASARRG